MSIRSKIHNYGDENESSWPPKFGTGGSGRMQWCPVQQKVVPSSEVMVEVDERTLAKIAHGYIQDEMPPTKHPIDGKHYTSAAKFRAVTRAHGFEEVGTAYENGYQPEKELEREFNRYIEGLNNEWRDRFFGK